MPSTPLVADILHKLQTIRFLPLGEKTGYYDEAVAPALAECAEAVRTDPGVGNVAQWLSLQSAALGFAVEGVSEITRELRETAPASFREALDLLSADSRSRLDWLTREFDGQENLPVPVVERMEARRETAAAPESGPVQGLFGGYQGQSTFTSTRNFPASHGVLALHRADGQSLGRWTVNSGGGAPNYRTTNGPVPPGVYLVSNHQPNRTTTGMVLDGVGFSFDLNETDGTEVYGRSLFRIHPDGGSPGTNGCLGIRESAAGLRDCESQIVGLIRDHGAFKISVRY